MLTDHESTSGTITTTTRQPQTHQLFAHRGFSGYQPEMTIAAFQSAIDWADRTGIRLGLECDVRFSADNQLICLHDDLLDRTCTIPGAAIDFTVAELKQFDFGSWHTPSPTSPQRTMITLAELLIMVREARERHVDVTLAIETKHPNPRGHDTEDQVAELLALHGWDRPGSPVRIISFSMDALLKIGRLLPGVERTYLQQFDFGEWSTGELPDGIEAFGPGRPLLHADPDFVSRARDHGHQIHPWTLNDPDEIDWCLGLGVHAVTTNYPDLALDRLNAAEAKEDVTTQRR